jgi:hypothetical protein
VKGTFSFHPVRLEFFDDTIQPLVAGRKINPEEFLHAGLRVRATSATARRWIWAIEEALAVSEPPRPERGAGLLKNIRAHLERFDHREDATTKKLRAAIEPDLHLYGRPFFITEGSAARVAERVDDYLAASDTGNAEAVAIEQLVHLGAELAKTVRPVEGPDLSPEMSYRSDLLSGLKELYDIAHAARRGESWGRADRPRRPAREILLHELPHKALVLHSRAVPFWIARDVDGLETVCRAAGVSPPEFLVPARRLFAETCEEFTELKDALQVEVRGPRDVGAFVAAGDIPELVEFLNRNGTRIIQAATRHDEGPACTKLLRKIRECAAYAERNGLGYLEASGILPPDLGGAEPDREGGAGA